MSNISTAIADVATKVSTLITKVDSLAASNATLTADAVAKDKIIADLQVSLQTAQANAADPADAAAIQAIEQTLADKLASLP